MSACTGKTLVKPNHSCLAEIMYTEHSMALCAVIMLLLPVDYRKRHLKLGTSNLFVPFIWWHWHFNQFHFSPHEYLHCRFLTFQSLVCVTCLSLLNHH